MIGNGLSIWKAAIRNQPLLAGGGAGPTIIASITVYGGLDVAITSPSTLSVPMNLNGKVIRVATSLGVTTISDLTKISLRVRDNGFDTSGNPTTVDRTIYIQDRLHRPYNEVTLYSPSTTGVFDLVLHDDIFNEDASNKTTILGVDFVAGWCVGGLTETVTSVSRLDSQAYPRPIVRPHFLPYEVVTSAGGNAATEWAVVSRFAMQLQAVARFEARAKVGGSYGAWTGAGSETRSTLTPSSGRNPSGFAAPVFACAGSVSGLTGPAAGAWEWRCYPWIGPMFDSTTPQTPSELTTGGATVAQANLGYSDLGADYNPLQSSRAVPFVLDGSTPSYTPAVAWVLYTGAGTATTSAKVFDNDFTDPGTALADNFASLATAATAIKSFNNARGHNDMAGGVIMLRDVAGGAEGTATGGYHNATPWANQTTWAVGIGRIEVRSVGGVPTPDCRMQSAKDDGAGGITIIAQGNRVVGQRVLWRGITFDGLAGYNQGAVAAQNIAIDGGAGGIPSTRPAESAAISQMFVDCRTRELSTAGSNAVFRQGGYSYFVRHDAVEVGGPGSVGYHSTFSGAVAYIGCSFYGANIGTAFFSAPLCSATYARGTACTFLVRGAHNLPRPQNYLLQHSRFDSTGTSTAAIVLSVSDAPLDGIGVKCVFARYVNVTSSNTSITHYADGNLFGLANSGWQGVGVDCGDSNGTADGGRVNVGYNEQGYNAVQREVTIQYCAFRSYNTKGHVMPAPERPMDGFAGSAQWSAGRAYFKGAVVWDAPGTADATSRVYQALQDCPAGTALSNAAYWEDHGLTALVAYGAQPLRTGNEGHRYAVGHYGNVASKTASADTTANASNSYYGIVWARGGAIQQTFADYYKLRVATGLTLTDTVDYRPKRIADGDGVDSPLLNRIPAGKAYAPFDIVGTAIPNDGTGAAGPYQA